MFQKICLAVLIFGGVCWGLLGFFNFNVVTWLLGGTLAVRGVYALFGVAGVACLPLLFTRREKQKDSGENPHASERA